MFKIKDIEKRIGASEGTLFFMLSALIIKVIGGIYKIPLYNLLGSDGIGLYQMVFPVYALLLTLSSGGIPSGITKLISGGENAQRVLKKCTKLFLPIGLLLSFFMFFLGDLIALKQGNLLAGSLYKAISPSVFIVCLLGCLRGYFQGKSNFIPTALSQIIEQVVKAVSGVIALLFTNGSYVKKAFLACIAVTLSEVISLAFMATVYFVKIKKEKLIGAKEEYKEKNDESKLTFKRLIVFILPLTLTSLCIPFASFIDSFIAVNALKNTFGEKATAVYGVYTGGVESVISLPVSVLHSLSLGFLPKITGDKNGQKSMLYVFILSCLAGIFTALFAPFITKILFGKNNEYLSLLTKLVTISSVNVIFHSTLHASSTYILAMGKQRVSLINLIIGIAVKVIIDFTLIKLPQINIFGMIISDVGCYFVALVLNLIYIYYSKKLSIVGIKYEDNPSRLRRRAKLPFSKSA
ncbi:MAG: oligosaccharide flippase family protein [Clostridia bacterium]|nr:oligosaccharide flippase family protein [Clostridia bacterium]